MFRTHEDLSSEPAPEPRSHQAEIDLLVDLARVSRVTVLYGDVASGREHVVRATVDALSKRRSAQGRTEVVVLFDGWDQPPLPALHARMIETVAAVAKEKGEATADFAARPLADSLAAWQKVLDLSFIIVFDRFERYLSLPSGRTGTAAFDAELVRMITEPGLRANIVIALQTDAEAQLLARFRRQVRRIADSSVRLAAAAHPTALENAPAALQAKVLPLRGDGRAPQESDSGVGAPTPPTPADTEAVPAPEKPRGPHGEGAGESRPTSPAHVAATGTVRATADAEATLSPPTVAAPAGSEAQPPRRLARVAGMIAVPLALAAALLVFVLPDQLPSRGGTAPPPALPVAPAPSVAAEQGGIAPAEPAAADAPPAAHPPAAHPAAADPVAPAAPEIMAAEGSGASAVIAAQPPAPAFVPQPAAAQEPAPPSVTAGDGVAPAEPPALAAPAPAAPGAALVIFVRNASQRAWAEKAIAALGSDGPRVSGINVVGTGPSASDLRYFHTGDRAEAEQLAHALQKAGFPTQQVKEISGFRARAAPRSYEVWLAPATELPQ